MNRPALPRPANTVGVVVAWVLAALLVAAIMATTWVAVRGYLAYGHLRKVETTASVAKADISDPAKASAAITRLTHDTSAARSLTSDPIWRLAEGLPWVGPQLHAVSTLAAAVDDVAGKALRPLADVAASFKLNSLQPTGGAINLSAFTSIRAAAATGAMQIGEAAASVDAIKRRPLVAPLRDAVDQVSALFGETETAAEVLVRTTTLLPPMLGADGPRNYLVIFQNNAELRSLGGISGAMALIHTDHGTMTMAAQDSSGGFPRYDKPVVPLSKEILGIYGERPAQWMQNVTLVPDFALTGKIAREMWAREHDGQKVDGVVSLDPVALSYLLQATGPVKLPSGELLSSKNAVSLLLNGVYLRYEDPREQDAFFASAAAAVFQALSDGRAQPAELVQALTRAGDERRLLLWSAHPSDQKILADTTLAGGLPVSDRTGTRFGVYLNDGTGSKMDYYLRDDVQVGWQGCSSAGSTTSGTATLTIKLTNAAPEDAASLPEYITGGGVYGVSPGTSRTIGYVYLPKGFQLQKAALSTHKGFGGGTHDGRQVLTFTFDLKPGQSASATFSGLITGAPSPELDIESTPTVNSGHTQPVAVSCPTA